MSRTDWNRPTPEQFQVAGGFRRIAMEVAYCGSDFCGWQQQDGMRTVQSDLQTALAAMLGFEVVVSGSGRTDSGVHARCQVCHFDLPETCTIPAKAFQYGLSLPKDVQVLRSYDAPPQFHSRFSAMAREYRYFIRSTADFTCFEEGRVSKMRKLPSLELLNSYAVQIRGTHDFSTFTGAGDASESHFRDIYESEFFLEESVYGGPVLIYRISGNAFLYHMVRSLVGTMMTLAKTNAPAESFGEILNSKDRSRALLTARSEGLYLWRICFDPEEFSWFEEKDNEQGEKPQEKGESEEMTDEQ